MANYRDIIVEPDSTPQPVAAPQTPEAGALPEPAPLPEKYQGKTIAEVAEMHINAEKKIGQQSNEVSAWRDAVSDLTALNRDANLSKTPTEPTAPEVKYTPEEILEKPELIQEIVRAELRASREFDRQTRATEDARRDMDKFEQDFPDWRNVSKTQDFQDWAKEDSSRTEDVRRTVQEGDVRAARRLMDGMTRQIATNAKLTPDPVIEPTAPTGLDGARQVASDAPGNAGVIDGDKIWYEQDVIRMKMNDPEKYMSAPYQEGLLSAIKGKRFRR